MLWINKERMDILNESKKGLLCEGYDADLAVFDNDIQIQFTIVGGKIAYKKQP